MREAITALEPVTDSWDFRRSRTGVGLVGHAAQQPLSPVLHYNPGQGDLVGGKFLGHARDRPPIHRLSCAEAEVCRRRRGPMVHLQLAPFCERAHQKTTKDQAQAPVEQGGEHAHRRHNSDRTDPFWGIAAKLRMRRWAGAEVATTWQGASSKGRPLGRRSSLRSGVGPCT